MPASECRVSLCRVLAWMGINTIDERTCAGKWIGFKLSLLLALNEAIHFPHWVRNFAIPIDATGIWKGGLVWREFIYANTRKDLCVFGCKCKTVMHLRGTHTHTPTNGANGVEVPTDDVIHSHTLFLEAKLIGKTRTRWLSRTPELKCELHSQSQFIRQFYLPGHTAHTHTHTCSQSLHILTITFNYGNHIAQPAFARTWCIWSARYIYGQIRAEVTCRPISKMCPKRRIHPFDLYFNCACEPPIWQMNGIKSHPSVR